MAVGKPDINLNSYGIKYFQKGEDSIDEVDESRDDIKVDSKIGGISVPKKPQTPKELEINEINRKLNLGNTKIQHNTGASRLRQQKIPKNPNNEVNIKDLEQDKKITSQAAPKPKHTKDTKYVFNAEQDPKSLSHYQSQLLEDANEARSKKPKPDPITGITPEKRRDYPTQGVIANSANVTSGEKGGRTEDITEVPDPRKRGGSQKELMNVGRTRPEGYKEPKGEKAERKRLSDKEKPDEKKEKETKEKETRETKDIPKKMGSRMVGNAPKEIPKKNTTEQSHSGKKVTVGVGSKAKEVFDKREGVGAVHEETSKPKTVVATPDKKLNTIGSPENKRLRDHNTEMDKFLKGATPAQRREYTAIKNREDGREDYDAQRAYARNITGKESKTQEKITQTKEEKESERRLEHADRMTDMKERDKRIKRDAWKEDEEFHKKIEEEGKTWQGKKEEKKDKEFHGTGKKEGKVSTIASKPKDKKPVPKDNPNALKPRKGEDEPDKITTDNINDKISAIATQLAQIKDPKKRAEKRLELSGQKEADKSKKEIEAAKKRVEAAKKKVEAAKKKKETSKKKKETAKKKKVVPKGDQLTPAQIKAYRAERQAKKDTVSKSNDIITEMNILKLDLMKNKPKKGNLVQDRAGQAIKQINSTAVKEKREKEMVMPTNNLLEHIHSKTKVPEGKGSPNDLGKSASETIFKAISLKLDLMNKVRIDHKDDDVTHNKKIVEDISNMQPSIDEKEEGIRRMGLQTRRKPCVNCGDSKGLIEAKKPEDKKWFGGFNETEMVNGERKEICPNCNKHKITRDLSQRNPKSYGGKSKDL